MESWWPLVRSFDSRSLKPLTDSIWRICPEGSWDIVLSAAERAALTSVASLRLHASCSLPGLARSPSPASVAPSTRKVLCPTLKRGQRDGDTKSHFNETQGAPGGHGWCVGRPRDISSLCCVTAYWVSPMAWSFNPGPWAPPRGETPRSALCRPQVLMPAQGVVARKWASISHRKVTTVGRQLQGCGEGLCLSTQWVFDCSGSFLCAQLI